MSKPDIAELYKQLLNAPFPRLGGSVGLFPAYDGDIAGCASRAASGETIDPCTLPTLDEESTEFVAGLRASRNRSAAEEEFLKYFDLLERIRQAIFQASI